MSTTPEKMAANRRNSLKSTGPKTVEGKNRSRRNGLKHGLTGEGIVLPIEDQVEVDRRFQALETELAPTTEMSLILVKRIATLSVRMERGVCQETANLAERVRQAPHVFDDRRLADVEKMFDWIAAEPTTNSRRLKSTPEGVDRLIKAWIELDQDIDHVGYNWWGYAQWQRIENLNGRRPEDFPMSREGALCKVIWNDLTFIDPAEVEGLDQPGRHAWARQKLHDCFAGEIARLRQLRESFDLAEIALDRAESSTRALFDPSKEATLARKYEAAAERGLYRALNELRQVEAEAIEPADADANPEPEETSATVASSFPESPTEQSEENLRGRSLRILAADPTFHALQPSPISPSGPS